MSIKPIPKVKKKINKKKAFLFSLCLTLNGTWLSESSGPSSSRMLPDWSPDTSCMVASRDSLVGPPPGLRAFARVSNALAHRSSTVKYYWICVYIYTLALFRDWTEELIFPNAAFGGGLETTVMILGKRSCNQTVTISNLKLRIRGVMS